MEPDRDLMPAREPGCVGDARDELETRQHCELGVIRGAEDVLAEGYAADSEISGVTFAAGKMPPRAGLAPSVYLDLRPFARWTRLSRRSSAELPSLVRQPK